MQFVILISAYITAFYIIVFNLYFDGIDRTMLRKSKFIKSLLKNVIILAILAGILTIFSTQNIVTEKFLTLNDEIELTGAGFVESTIKLWGYIIFAFVIIGAIISSVIFFQKNKNQKNNVYIIINSRISSCDVYCNGRNRFYFCKTK